VTPFYRLSPEEVYGIKEPFNEPVQKLPKAYASAGYFSAIRNTTILEKKSMTGPIILGYVCEAKNATDIDTPFRLDDRRGSYAGTPSKTSMNSFTHIHKAVIDESLAAAPVVGKHQLEPLMTLAKAGGVPLNILEDHQITDNEAEIHTEEADLWLCLEGEITFICGGEMDSPWFKKLADGSEDKTQVKAKSISQGTEVLVKAGDWLWIPAGVPHQHNTPNTARLAIIKVPKK
jgi:mannose-6-phosphate isomerase-like protein (cupin superfamily)